MQMKTHAPILAAQGMLGRARAQTNVRTETSGMQIIQINFVLREYQNKNKKVHAIEAYSQTKRMAECVYRHSHVGGVVRRKRSDLSICMRSISSIRQVVHTVQTHTQLHIYSMEIAWCVLS